MNNGNAACNIIKNSNKGIKCKLKNLPHSWKVKEQRKVVTENQISL